MKRRWLVAICLGLLAPAGYFAFSKLAIRHQTLDLLDAARHRHVAVDIAVRRDAEFKANAGLAPLPVAIVSHGNTVRNTEYSFLANVLAGRGFLVVSIQHDLPDDAPLMTREGSLYVGRLGVYERGQQNIFFVVDALRKIQPNADYSQLTLLGHSNGGDISMFFAQQHPELVRKVVTLDNLRVPLLKSGPKVLSFRSSDPVFKADKGVVPDEDEAKKSGVDVVHTGARHNEMSDRGPDDVNTRIQDALDKFLGTPDTSKLAPVTSDPATMGP